MVFGKAGPLGGEVTSHFGSEGVDSRAGTSAFGLAAEDSVHGTKVANFKLPVDKEHKATVIRLWSFAAPHMSTFHMAWLAFFISFCSTFMAAPLMPVIRDDLNMTNTQVGNANSASVAGTVFCRLFMGYLCDSVGPRRAYGLLMILTSFPCFAMTCVTTYPQFLVCRCLIGFSLAAFVSTQYWTSQMFTPKIVGGANAITAGWGNLGGGVTQVVTIIMFQYYAGYGPYVRAWRQCYFAPGLLHLAIGMCILFLGQDGPDGNHTERIVGGKKTAISRSEARNNFRMGMLNYRTWVFTITYGFCFGVELVLDNILANYFFSQFNLNLIQAGRIASYSGLMNVVSRASGGFMSDVIASRFGMRGRLWWLWFVMTSAGGVCVAFGYQTTSLAHATTTMVIFSYLCHCGCGATYGIVPFISKRSLGVVSGSVGAGGNAISAILQWCFFTNTQVIVPLAIRNLGITIMAFSTLICLVHFPMWGSMFVGPTLKSDGTSDVLPEEVYYTSHYTEAEKAAGLSEISKKFAENAVSERSNRGVRSPSTANLEQVEVVDAKAAADAKPTPAA